MFSTAIFALFGIFMIIGQAFSSISDWIGREQTITIATILAIGGLVALILVSDTNQPWLLYIYAICFGCGAGLYSPAIFAAAADIFYGRSFGAISGLLLTGMGIGGFIGPWLGGYIYDVTGSYFGAFLLCMVCFGLSCVSAWIAAPRHIRKLSSI
jgi:MFS family permease